MFDSQLNIADSGAKKRSLICGSPGVLGGISLKLPDYWWAVKAGKISLKVHLGMADSKSAS